MSQPALRIDARLRARLRGLRLETRAASRALGIGQHQSRSRGAGLEFLQYRAYEPGDEPRRIDWKLFARSDRIFVREAERDSSLRVWVLLDASASMAQADQATPEWCRFDAARLIALCAFELALRQGDAFGLVQVRSDGVEFVPIGTGSQQQSRVTHALEGAAAGGGSWPAAARLRPIWERVHAGDLLIMLGDHFDDAAVALIEQLSRAGRDVASVVMTTVDERDFAFEGGWLMRDPETGRELLTDASSARTRFRADFAAARAALSRRLAAAGIRSTESVIDEPADAPLRRLFGPRAREA